MAKKSVYEELLEATKVKKDKDASEQEHLGKICREVANLSDKDWEGLSSEAQNWYNDAADAMNERKDIATPEGFEVPVEEPAPTTRRRASVAEEEPTADYEPKVGDKVKIVTSRDKEVSGKVVEVDDKILVIDDGAEEVEYNRERLKSVDLAEEPSSGRRRAAAEEEPEKEDKKEEPAERPKRTPPTRNAGGVSATQRMRELVCENLDWSMDDVAKALKKENFEFKESTLSIMYSDCKKTIECLQKYHTIK
jgi:small nuclear ribonucleoprotein (snRNP)-like protein